MRRLLARYVRHAALKHGKHTWLYLRLCRPNGTEYAEFLKQHGRFYSIGEDCYISPVASIVDPQYVRIGNNVRISDCTLLCHDGSVNMINRVFGIWLDHVGKIDIKDNVYLGHGCIILPGVTIGPNAIVTAGSVVRSDVKEGDVVAGVPARTVGRFGMSVEILKAKSKDWPWMPLIEQRASDHDPEMEPELERIRIEYFFGKKPAP